MKRYIRKLPRYLTEAAEEDTIIVEEDPIGTNGQTPQGIDVDDTPMSKMANKALQNTSQDPDEIEDWQAAFNKANNNAQEITRLWARYFKQEWGDKFGDNVEKAVKKLGSTFTMELTKLGFTKTVNPFIAFLESNVVENSTSVNEAFRLDLMEGRYGAVHNAYVRGYITKTDLRKGEAAGGGENVKNSLLYNPALYEGRNANTVLDYLEYEASMRTQLEQILGDDDESIEKILYQLFDPNQKTIDYKAVIPTNESLLELYATSKGRYILNEAAEDYDISKLSALDSSSHMQDKLINAFGEGEEEEEKTFSNMDNRGQKNLVRAIAQIEKQRLGSFATYLYIRATAEEQRKAIQKLYSNVPLTLEPKVIKQYSDILDNIHLRSNDLLPLLRQVKAMTAQDTSNQQTSQNQQ